MKISDTDAKDAPWVDYAEPLLEGWDIVSCVADISWSGEVLIIAKRGGTYRYMGWVYGTCSYCDEYDGMTDSERTEAFKKLCQDYATKADLEAAAKSDASIEKALGGMKE